MTPMSQISVMKTIVNRISGPLEVEALDQFETLEVLNGNLISCSTLPSSDAYVSKYFCGTRNLEISLYICISVSVIAILYFAILFKVYRPNTNVTKGMNELNYFSKIFCCNNFDRF